MSFHEVVAPIEEVIEEARNGRMFILVDDEDRENEGDIVIPAQMATPEVINFMAKHARGLICLALPRKRIEELKLPLMPQHNASRLQTAFTVSIEAREGVTTGISAPDRARTVAVAIDPTKGAADLVTPGHIFPLAAREGGVLVRTGHTEAAVDIARAAGLTPAGVICEIMNDDGTMARRSDLVAFAQRHNLKIATIADLIAWRRRNERIVERKIETELTSRFGGDFKMVVYGDKISQVEHVALVKGDPTRSGVRVRMHALSILDDVLGRHGASDCGGRGALEAAMTRIGQVGHGVIVLLRDPSPTVLTDRLRRAGETGEGRELRDYGVGAQILLDLGVRDMTLLSNNLKTVVGLDGYGLHISGQEPITGEGEPS